MCSIIVEGSDNVLQDEETETGARERGGQGERGRERGPEGGRGWREVWTQERTAGCGPTAEVPEEGRRLPAPAVALLPVPAPFVR
ncbi:hypothetical protein AWH69_13395 [Janibacter melonis]|uniref:Uncharacterized protein n=1 Tax=Janibacter melonis TaxID=262209 RepID=A0A176Q9I2_9MICO|nr:hypothetical protein AWH69_13395 [Janibacter melonis]